MFTSLLIPALTFGPELVADAKAVFNDLAHGPGGVAKIEKALAALALLVEHAATAASSAGVPGVSEKLGATIANVAAHSAVDINDIINTAKGTVPVVEPVEPASLDPNNKVVGASGVKPGPGDPGFVPTSAGGSTGATGA